MTRSAELYRYQVWGQGETTARVIAQLFLSEQNHTHTHTQLARKHAHTQYFRIDICKMCNSTGY